MLYNIFDFKIDVKSGSELAGLSLVKPLHRGSPDLAIVTGRMPSRKSRGRKALVGTCFVLDTQRRRLWYRPPETERSVLERREHWVRTALVALSLLGETAATARNPRRFILRLHASAVATRKGALVFTGHSTYGKSTISSELLCRCPLLEDDVVLLHCRTGTDGRLRSKLLSPRRYAEANFGQIAGRREKDWALPLAGIFWLKKSHRFHVSPMPAARAAAGMLSPALAGQQPNAVATRLRLLRRFLEATPCGLLEFRKHRQGLAGWLCRLGYLP